MIVVLCLVSDAEFNEILHQMSAVFVVGLSMLLKEDVTLAVKYTLNSTKVRAMWLALSLSSCQTMSPDEGER